MIIFLTIVRWSQAQPTKGDWICPEGSVQSDTGHSTELQSRVDESTTAENQYVKNEYAREVWETENYLEGELNEMTGALGGGGPRC